MSRKKASRIGESPLSSPNQMLSKIQVAQIRALSASNHSMRHISKMTGISRNTVSKYLKGAEPLHGVGLFKLNGWKTTGNEFVKSFSMAEATVQSCNAT